VDEEKSPFVSQRLGSFLGSRVGFSPTTSAVLYHGGRGDLLASTASFRDVLNSKMDVQQEEVVNKAILKFEIGILGLGERNGVCNWLETWVWNGLKAWIEKLLISKKNWR